MFGEENTSQISLGEMDALVASLKAAQEEYKAASKAAEEKNAAFSELKEKLIDILKKQGKSTYIAEGVARITVVEKMSVKTPKSPEEKKAFFAWLAKHKGQEVADAYLSVNSNSLNSLYNELTEEFAARGEVLMVDGLEDPISLTSLSIVKA